MRSRISSGIFLNGDVSVLNRVKGRHGIDLIAFVSERCRLHPGGTSQATIFSPPSIEYSNAAMLLRAVRYVEWNATCTPFCPGTIEFRREQELRLARIRACKVTVHQTRDRAIIHGLIWTNR